MSQRLYAPFPFFGGKRRVADLVWSRFGDVATYNEPFAGSLAVLLGRPTAPRIETVNDLDAYIANFWRALQAAPDLVAKHADSPVNEADLHSRHRWLVASLPAFSKRLREDPHYFDATIAGWWVWGQCLWIGSGWCEATRPPVTTQRPETGLVNAKGVHALHKKRPALKDSGPDGVSYRRWQGGGQGGGSGVHAPRLLAQQIPDLSGDSGASGRGIHACRLSGGLYAYMRALADRLRRVRVCCGDWGRVLTPSVTTYIGVCGVLLDPPYSHDLRQRCYAEDHDISADVRAWALAHGDDPLFRIALCGYEGEHQMPASWECVPWKAHGGYSRSERGVANRSRERIWFSKFCLRPSDRLF